jgi:ribosomal-protein-alanine N-acetyltransferase
VSIEIRQAILGDAAALSRLHGAAFEAGWTEADMTTWLSRNEALAVIATHGPDAAAFGLALAAGDDAELFTIATAADKRRQGLGDKIFCTLDALAAERGLKRWVLEVARNNLPARRFYESEGFVEIGVRKAYYDQGEGRADALVLARPVGLVSGHKGA